MKVANVAVLLTAVLASIGSGISKQLEAPLEAAAFQGAGLPAEILSLYGAVEFVLALALLFPRMRRPAAVTLAVLFALSARWLLPGGAGPLFWFNAAMVPLVLCAGFWPTKPGRRESPYGGAIPLGFSTTRR